MSVQPSIGDVVVAVAGRMAESRDLLNRLDGAAGDGDLGLTAGRAAEALIEIAPSLAGLSGQEALKSVGMTLAGRAPSTSGTLVAFACLAAARIEARVDRPATATIADCLDAARDEISRRGKVSPGDRTMLDAIAPAAAAFRAASDLGASIGSCLSAAAQAADGGATATIGMEATTGRAGWLADRARGQEDAGARLVAIVLSGAAGAFAVEEAL